MPVALHCVDQPSDHLAESFATDSIGGLPNDRQRFSNGFIVDPRPLSRLQGFPVSAIFFSARIACFR